MRRTPWRQGFGYLLCGFAALWLAVLAQKVALRIVFPWDLYIWSESPFMTNMLKLSAGQWPYTAPADANSFVYSPGLEVICFALLKPLGLALDVRACRVVVVLLGLLASACVTGSASLLAAATDERGQAPPLLRVFVFPAATLLIFRNFTADVCHPDNLFILHAMGSLYLSMRAVRGESYRWALGSVGVASLACWVKQTAVLGGLGVAVALVVLTGDRWSRLQRALLIPLAAAVTGAAVGVLRIDPNSRFFLFELLLRHPLQWGRMQEAYDSLLVNPHRALLVAAAAVALARFAWSRRPLTWPFVVCWALAGVEVLPALGAFLKANGCWNNFTVIEVWLSVLVLPAAWLWVASAAHGPLSMLARLAATATLAALVFWLQPAKLAPTPEQYAFGQRLEGAILKDTREGKRVLLPHGTMPLIRAGLLTPPQDRSNSVLELRTGGHPASATLKRIREGYYSRIYMLQSMWYGGDITRAIHKHYRQTGVIAGDRSPLTTDDFLTGYGNYMRQAVRVFEAKAPALNAAASVVSAEFARPH